MVSSKKQLERRIRPKGIGERWEKYTDSTQRPQYYENNLVADKASSYGDEA